jgi:hypothetical protein
MHSALHGQPDRDAKNIMRRLPFHSQLRMTLTRRFFDDMYRARIDVVSFSFQATTEGPV